MRPSTEPATAKQTSDISLESVKVAAAQLHFQLRARLEIDTEQNSIQLNISSKNCTPRTAKWQL